MSGFQFGRRGRSKANKVYTPDERAEYVRRAKKLLAKSEMTVTAAAEKLGVNPGTLYTWLRQPPAVGSFLPVSVTPVSGALVPIGVPTPTARPVVVSPDGYRVEGLDLEGVAELLRRLS